MGSLSQEEQIFIPEISAEILKCWVLCLVQGWVVEMWIRHRLEPPEASLLLEKTDIDNEEMMGRA